MKKSTKAPAGETQSIEIAAPIVKVILVKIRGIAPLVIHKFSEKAKTQIAAAQSTAKSESRLKSRAPKDPFAIFAAALHQLPDGSPCMPATAFKAAIVESCRGSGLTMSEMKQCIFIRGEGPESLVRIIAPPITEPQTAEDRLFAEKLAPYHARGVSMRSDMARNANGGADVRWRPWLPQWGATVAIEFVANNGLTEKTVVTLLAKAGICCGIGEWRPSSPFSKSGMLGRFEVID